MTGRTLQQQLASEIDAAAERVSRGNRRLDRRTGVAAGRRRLVREGPAHAPDLLARDALLRNQPHRPGRRAPLSRAPLKRASNISTSRSPSIAVPCRWSRSSRTRLRADDGERSRLRLPGRPPRSFALRRNRYLRAAPRTRSNTPASSRPGARRKAYDRQRSTMSASPSTTSTSR